MKTASLSLDLTFCGLNYLKIIIQSQFQTTVNQYISLIISQLWDWVNPRASDSDVALIHREGIRLSDWSFRDVLHDQLLSF